jgi:hypothetical protein
MRLLVGSVGVLITVGLGVSLPANAGTPGDWTGTWDTTTGSGNPYTYEFHQSGSTVTGTESRPGHNPVSITNGVASGNTLTFRTEEVPGYIYDYEFTMDASGDNMTGKWGYYYVQPGSYTGGTYTGTRRGAGYSGELILQLSPCNGDGTYTVQDFTVKRRGCRSYSLRAIAEPSYSMGGTYVCPTPFTPPCPYSVWIEDAIPPGNDFDDRTGRPTTCRFGGNYPIRREGGNTCLLLDGGNAANQGQSYSIQGQNPFKGVVSYRATLRQGGEVVKTSNIIEVDIKGPKKRRR